MPFHTLRSYAGRQIDRESIYDIPSVPGHENVVVFCPFKRNVSEKNKLKDCLAIGLVTADFFVITVQTYLDEHAIYLFRFQLQLVGSSQTDGPFTLT